ncbi:MAG: hypothetical protein II702_00865 [Clostridia bacterium]|jgi:hypothetical protein|nr:hypothetical protein [Clostridia bacterium]
MDINALLAQGVELAQKITGFLGEFEAAGILAMVKEFLTKIDLSAISNLISSITGLLG